MSRSLEDILRSLATVEPRRVPGRTGALFYTVPSLPDLLGLLALAFDGQLEGRLDLLGVLLRLYDPEPPPPERAIPRADVVLRNRHGGVLRAFGAYDGKDWAVLVHVKGRAGRWWRGRAGRAHVRVGVLGDRAVVFGRLGPWTVGEGPPRSRKRPMAEWVAGMAARLGAEVDFRYATPVIVGRHLRLVTPGRARQPFVDLSVLPALAGLADHMSVGTPDGVRALALRLGVTHRRKLPVHASPRRMPLKGLPTTGDARRLMALVRTVIERMDVPGRLVLDAHVDGRPLGRVTAVTVMPLALELVDRRRDRGLTVVWADPQVRAAIADGATLRFEGGGVPLVVRHDLALVFERTGPVLVHGTPETVAAVVTLVGHECRIGVVDGPVETLKALGFRIEPTTSAGLLGSVGAALAGAGDCVFVESA